MNDNQLLGRISHRLCALQRLLRQAEEKQAKTSKTLIQTQKQVKRLQCGVFKLGFEEWDDGDCLANYNKIDELKKYTVDIYRAMLRNQHHIKDIKYEIACLSRMLKTEYKVVSLRA